MENNSDAHKASCQYGVDISKQFITLASAGMAFVAGLVVSKKAGLTFSQTVYLFSFLGLSIAFGLFFLMRVIGHINKSDNYNVYTISLRILASFQIILFIFGASILGYATINIAKNKPSITDKSPASFLEIKIDNREIKQPVFEGSLVEIEMTKDNDLKLKVLPADEPQKSLPKKVKDN